MSAPTSSSVPGNHDVVWDKRPASHERYDRFLAATRPLGCTTPLIDGIDFDEKTATLTGEAGKYPHLATGEEAVVIPLNSSNYCGIPVTPADGWDQDRWLAELAPLGDDEVLRQLRKLVRQDVARISVPRSKRSASCSRTLGCPKRRTTLVFAWPSCITSCCRSQRARSERRSSR